MTNPSALPDAGEGLARAGILWLQRIAGLALFAIGVAYWVRLVGVFPGANWRFDLMSLDWRVATLTLAVLCPVAGVGLWLTASWGTVVWMLVAAVEIVMHTALRRVFGPAAWEATAIIGGIVLLAVLRVGLWIVLRRSRGADRHG